MYGIQQAVGIDEWVDVLFFSCLQEILKDTQCGFGVRVTVSMRGLLRSMFLQTFIFNVTKTYVNIKKCNISVMLSNIASQILPNNLYNHYLRKSRMVVFPGMSYS